MKKNLSIFFFILPISFSISIFLTPQDTYAMDYNCDPHSRYIDVSMCPGYSEYANNENANAAVFFNEIIRRAVNAKTSPSEEVSIKIPKANFFFFKNPNNPLEASGIILDGEAGEIYSNISIEGTSEPDRPTFVDKDQYIDKDYLLWVKGNTNFTLKNVIFKGNSKNKYLRGVIALYNNKGNIYVHNIKCSGTYRDMESPYVLKANVCLRIMKSNDYPPSEEADYVEVLNSEFYSYDVGLATAEMKKVNLSNNIFDNENPCPECQYHHHRGSISLSSNFTNRLDTSGRSIISGNVFKSNGQVDGQTGIGIIGESNKIDIQGNEFYNIQDRVIYVSSHGLRADLETACHGGPKDITIRNNYISGAGHIRMGSTIEAISVLNQPRVECGNNTEKATIRGITISGNIITGVKGGIELSSTPHAPLHTVDVYNNQVMNSGFALPKWWFGDANLTGSCIRMIGLKGKDNDPNDIKIRNNRLENCEVGMYFMASWWPYSESSSAFASYATQNQKNEYISVINNTINNSGPIIQVPTLGQNKIDIITQEQPTKAITNIDSIVIHNNWIMTQPKSSRSDNRCNVACASNNDCLGEVPTLYGSGTSIVNNYPHSYVCSSGKCRNSEDVEDLDCDLNPAPPTNYKPLIDKSMCEGRNERACCYNLVVCEIKQEQSEKKFSNCHNEACVPNEYKTSNARLGDYWSGSYMNGRDLEALRRLLTVVGNPAPPPGYIYVK